MNYSGKWPIAVYPQGVDVRAKAENPDGGAVDPRSDSELPDTRLPAARRDELKKIVRNFEASHSDEELMYLACAFDDAAHRKTGQARAT